MLITPALVQRVQGRKYMFTFHLLLTKKRLYFSVEQHLKLSSKSQSIRFNGDAYVRLDKGTVVFTQSGTYGPKPWMMWLRKQVLAWWASLALCVNCSGSRESGRV